MLGTGSESLRPWLLAALPWLAACSAVVEPDLGDLGPRPAACAPGTYNAFTCGDGTVVSQRCTDEGRFEVAVCPPPTNNPIGCSPNTTMPCTCPNGSSSMRLCTPQGTLTGCACGGTGVAGSAGG